MQESRLEELKVKGWNQMHSILDKEMPQKKKDRKFPFFWLLIGMLFGIGTFYVYNRFSNQNERENTIANKTNIIASNEPQIQSEASPSNVNNINNNSSSNVQQNSISSNSISAASTTNTSSVNTSSSNQLALNSSNINSEKLKSGSINSKSTSKIAKADIHHSNNSASNSIVKSNSSEKVIIENALEWPMNSNSISFQTNTSSEANKDFSNEGTSSNSIQEGENTSSHTLINLEELGSNIQLLKHETKNNIIIPSLQINSINRIHIKNKSPYNIMLASNVNLNSWTKHLSYDIGLVQQYHLLKKLSITLGAKYEFTRSSNDLINCSIFHFQDNNEIFADNRGEAFNFPSSKSYPLYDKVFNIDKSAKYVTNVQSLNIPLRLNYHFNSKWSLGLGTEYSVLLNRNAMKLDSFAYTCLINVKTSNFDYIRIRNNEFRYSASLTYRLNNKININCDASYYRDRYDYSNILIPSPTGTPWPLSDINYERNFFNFGIGVQYRIY